MAKIKGQKRIEEETKVFDNFSIDITGQSQEFGEYLIENVIKKRIQIFVKNINQEEFNEKLYDLDQVYSHEFIDTDIEEIAKQTIECLQVEDIKKKRVIKVKDGVIVKNTALQLNPLLIVIEYHITPFIKLIFANIQEDLDIWVNKFNQKEKTA